LPLVNQQSVPSKQVNNLTNDEIFHILQNIYNISDEYNLSTNNVASNDVLFFINGFI
ncbi:unnamed protein product, partial [marine sediment metagenome]